MWLYPLYRLMEERILSVSSESILKKSINSLFDSFAHTMNVVWQTTEEEDFRQMASCQFLKARNLGVPCIYIRFSDTPVFQSLPAYVNVRHIPLTHHFETFTMAVYSAIRESGKGCFFVFDSLSDLQTAWATDMMMKNFFRVITPVVLQMESQAYYPVLRYKHSEETYEEIREQTEVFLDLYSDFKNLYMRPQKILDEDSEEICIPYIYDFQQQSYRKTQGGIELSHFLKATTMGLPDNYDPHKDFWDHFFDTAQKRFEDGKDISRDCETMCQIMMSRDPKIREMVKKHFKPTDYFFIREHMIGTGLIGGKACGMLTARKIVENRQHQIYENFEAHDSFFIGSDVFYSYIVENDFWDLRVKQRTKEGYFDAAEECVKRIMEGHFSEHIEKQFIRLLNYYGHSPIIVRSSSLLEDGFGNAFAGKYESVFCISAGSMEERLEEFEQAIRIVYASTMSKSALDYRLRRGLDNRDEQMSLLVMRVSGSFYGDYYLPCAAGVGYSYSTYRFLETLDPEAGMLRLVMGLGTSAVDRTEGSYPRLVSMDKPAATAFKSIGEHHRYSQQGVDVINRRSRQMEQLPFSRLLPYLPQHVRKQVLQHDFDAERRFRDRGERRDIFFVSCQGLVKNQALMTDLKDLMHTIQEEYQQPVDIEYAINVTRQGDYFINLLQCRPLQVFKDTKKVTIPRNLDPAAVFVDCSHTSMGLSQRIDLDAIVYVDPIAYYNMPYNDKSKVANLIGKINWTYRGQGRKMLLMVPGRIGTSSPELGVPTAFADISEFRAIFEISESKVGYNPELSFGSHIFQDLVENEILYMAVMEDETRACFAPEKITAMENRILDIDPNAAELSDIVAYYDVRAAGCRLYHDLLNERLVCTIGEEE